MAKTAQTLNLEKRLYHTVIKRAVFGTFEVTLGWYGKERVDFMTYDCKGIFRCYEIKVSLSDFHSKAKVSFVGNFNYYVMPSELYEKVWDEIPAHVGVYVGSGEPCVEIDGKKYWKELTLVKRPKRQEIALDREVMLASLIRCLHRDAEKYNRLNDDLANIEVLKKNYEAEIREKERNYKNMVEQYYQLTADLRRIYGDDFIHDFHVKRLTLPEDYDCNEEKKYGN